MQAQKNAGFSLDKYQSYILQMHAAAIAEVSYKWVTEGTEDAEEITRMVFRALKI